MSDSIPVIKDGEPCAHPGCLHHVSHPCEGCGRIAGRSFYGYTRESLASLCLEILGRLDETKALPVLVEQAALTLFKSGINAPEFCVPLRNALDDLAVHGHLRFAD